jgi:hypothetical protein
MYTFHFFPFLFGFLLYFTYPCPFRHLVVGDRSILFCAVAFTIWSASSFPSVSTRTLIHKIIF